VPTGIVGHDGDVRGHARCVSALWEGVLARDAMVAVETLRRGLKPPPTNSLGAFAQHNGEMSGAGFDIIL